MVFIPIQKVFEGIGTYFKTFLWTGSYLRKPKEHSNIQILTKYIRKHR